jgi:hypothetical protein
MDIGFFSKTPIYQRLPVERDTATRVTTYGEDNLYPERMRSTLLLSPVGKSCVTLLASFIRGDGFERGDEVINDFGDTANDVLHVPAGIPSKKAKS